MKKIAALFASLILIVQMGKSQISTSTGQSGSTSDVSFTLGSFGHWPLAQPGQTGNTKRSYYILETGDGGFFADLNSSPSYIYNNLRGGTNTTAALLTLSGRYDTIKPPPIFAKTISSSNSTANLTLPTRLSGSQKIKITPIANELNANDEMLYVLTYRVPENAINAKIVLIYKSPEFDVFENCDNTSTIAVTADPGASIDNVNRLRTYFGEKSFSNAPMVSIINSTPGSASILENSNNASCLSWVWDENDQSKKYLEHNIFISLKTKDNLPVNTTGYIEAALLYTTSANGKTGNGYNNKSTTSLLTLVSGNPHDPNYIIAAPRCIVKQPAGSSKKIDYHIHFQNEGNAEAHDIIVTVFMDQRLKDKIARLNNQSFSVKAGIGLLRPAIEFKDNEDGSFNLTLKIQDSTLASNRVQDWFVNPVTMGDISFKLEVPIDVEADFIAKAGIVFTSALGTKMAPVYTNPDTLFIRSECSGMTYPRPKPLPDPSHNCKKLGPLCWYWWVAIGVGVLFLIWLIRKRSRRNTKADY